MLYPANQNHSELSDDFLSTDILEFDKSRAKFSVWDRNSAPKPADGEFTSLLLLNIF